MLMDNVAEGEHPHRSHPAGNAARFLVLCAAWLFTPVFAGHGVGVYALAIWGSAWWWLRVAGGVALVLGSLAGVSALFGSHRRSRILFLAAGLSLAGAEVCTSVYEPGPRSPNLCASVPFVLVLLWFLLGLTSEVIQREPAPKRF